MNHINTFIIFLLLTICANAFALTRYDQRGYPYRYRCPPKCYYYYGYIFDNSMFDYEVDNACVDFCLDKKHNLQYCTHVCSNYTRALDYPPEIHGH
jgi:hypothetical protein